MKNRPIKFKKAIRVSMTLGLLSLSAILTGCGSTAYREGVDNTGGASTGAGTGSAGGTGTGTAAGPGTTAGTTPTNNTQVATGNYSYRFRLTGGQSTNMSAATETEPSRPMRVSTDTLLRVKVTAGNAVQFQTTGWDVGFNCQRYTVTVEGQSLRAFVLRDGYTPTAAYDPCFAAKTEETLDFSGRLSPGHGAITISASGAQYDNCRDANQPRFGGCSIHQVYTTHLIEGVFNIEVNSTQ